MKKCLKSTFILMKVLYVIQGFICICLLSLQLSIPADEQWGKAIKGTVISFRVPTGYKEVPSDVTNKMKIQVMEQANALCEQYNTPKMTLNDLSDFFMYENSATNDVVVICVLRWSQGRILSYEESFSAQKNRLEWSSNRLGYNLREHLKTKIGNTLAIKSVMLGKGMYMESWTLFPDELPKSIVGLDFISGETTEAHHENFKMILNSISFPDNTNDNSESRSRDDITSPVLSEAVKEENRLENTIDESREKIAKARGIEWREGVLYFTTEGEGIIDTSLSTEHQIEELERGKPYVLPRIKMVGEFSYVIKENMGNGKVTWEGSMMHALFATKEVLPLFDQEGATISIQGTFKGKVEIAGHTLKAGDTCTIRPGDQDIGGQTP